MEKIAAGYFGVGNTVLFGRWKNKRGIIKRLFTDDRGVPMVEIEPVPKGRKKNKTFSLFKIWHATPPSEENQVMSSVALRVAAKFQAGKGATSLPERVAAKFDALNSRSKSAALGETTERGTVRIHQYMDHFRVWDLTNAGKRGKTVRTMVIAPNIRGNAQDWVLRMGEHVLVHYDSYDEIKATFTDMLHDKPGEIRITENTLRGVDVIPANIRKIQLKWTVKDTKMELTATPLEFIVKDSWQIEKDGKAIGWQDTLTYERTKADAKVFYSWVASNEDAVKKLDINGLKKAMMDLNIRFESH